MKSTPGVKKVCDLHSNLRLLARFSRENVINHFSTQTLGEWRSVFYISSGVSLFGCITFGILASGVIQEWNKSDYNVIPTSPINSPD